MKKLSEIFGGFKSTNKDQQTRSCCSGNENDQKQHIHSDSKKAYQCPMKCEGNKTYNEAGSCPKCNMHLEVKE